MQPPRDSARPGAAITAQRRLRRAAPALALLLICPLHAGCGAGAPSSAPSDAALVLGARGGPIAAPRLATASRLAQRFAATYARSAYLRHPPRLPGASGAVGRALAAAAARVPAARRRLRPGLLALALQPLGALRLSASARIGDGRSPPFSVGFTVGRVGRRWRVTAISPPG